MVSSNLSMKEFKIIGLNSIPGVIYHSFLRIFRNLLQRGWYWIAMLHYLLIIYCLVALSIMWDYNDLEGKMRVYLTFLLNFPVGMFRMKEFKLFSYLFIYFLLNNLFVTLSKLPPNFLYHYWVLRVLNGFYRFIWLCFP